MRDFQSGNIPPELKPMSLMAEMDLLYFRSIIQAGGTIDEAMVLTKMRMDAQCQAANADIDRELKGYED